MAKQGRFDAELDDSAVREGETREQHLARMDRAWAKRCKRHPAPPGMIKPSAFFAKLAARGFPLVQRDGQWVVLGLGLKGTVAP